MKIAGSGEDVSETQHDVNQAQDLGIVVPPPARLSDRPRRRPHAPPGPSGGGAASFLGTLGSIALAGVLYVAERTWEVNTRPDPPAVLLAPARPALPGHPAGFEEGRDADDRADRALRDEEQAREARDARIREAARLVPGRDLVDSAELDGGRRHAFLSTLPSGKLYTEIVEAGEVKGYASGDRWTWETATAEAMAGEWADRAGGSSFEVLDASRGDFGMTATVIDRVRRSRFRLEMLGFDRPGHAVLRLDPLD